MKKASNRIGTLKVDAALPAEFPQEAKEIWDYKRLPVPPSKYFSPAVQKILKNHPFTIQRLNAVNCGQVQYKPYKTSVRVSMLGIPGGDINEQGNIGIYGDVLALIRSRSVLGNSQLPQLNAIQGMAAFLAALPQVDTSFGMKPRKEAMQSNLVWGLRPPKGISLDTKRMREVYKRYCTTTARDRVKTAMISIQQVNSSRGPSMNFTIRRITTMGTRDPKQVMMLARIAIYLSACFFIPTPKKQKKKRVSTNDTPAIGDMQW